MNPYDCHLRFVAISAHDRPSSCCWRVACPRPSFRPILLGRHRQPGQRLLQQPGFAVYHPDLRPRRHQLAELQYRCRANHHLRSAVILLGGLEPDQRSQPLPDPRHPQRQRLRGAAKPGGLLHRRPGRAQHPRLAHDYRSHARRRIFPAAAPGSSMRRLPPPASSIMARSMSGRAARLSSSPMTSKTTAPFRPRKAASVSTPASRFSCPSARMAGG